MSARSIGMILLAIWLIIFAILALTNIEIVYVRVIHGVLAAIAGGCLLFAELRSPSP